MPTTLRGSFTIAIRSVIALVIFFTLLVGARLATRGTPAKAAADAYYPSFCLGGWANPKAASGAPDTPESPTLEDFSSSNAALLEPDVSSIIYCGYFSVEAREYPPQEARVSFRWSLDAQSPEGLVTIPEVPVTAPSQEEAVVPTPQGEPSTEPVSQTELDSEIATPSDPTSPAADAPPKDVPTASATTPSETSPEAPPQNTALPAESLPVEASGAAPSSPPVPEAPPTSWLFSVAHAQETQTAAPRFTDILQVSYSIDGVRWYKVGKVSPLNWRDFSVTVPTTSWDDLQNLQIMVTPLPAAIDRPAIYLDAVELTVESDRTIVEVVSEGAQNALAVVDTVADAVVNLFAGEEQSHVASVQEALAPASPQEVPAAPRQKAKRLHFTLGGEVREVTQDLPWYDEKFRASLGTLRDVPAPSVSVSEDGLSMRVSGACTEAYYVVLTFKGPDDYLKSPQSFASNYAGDCAGSFSYDFGNLPLDTPPGTYFLLVAEQGTAGAWVPKSDLLPITIGVVEIDS